MILVIAPPEGSQSEAQMVAPHGRVRAMVPVTPEVAQSSQMSGLPMLALEEVGQVGRPFLPAGSAKVG